jgi:hypothetical protein
MNKKMKTGRLVALLVLRGTAVLTPASMMTVRAFDNDHTLVLPSPLCDSVQPRQPAQSSGEEASLR